MDIELNKAQKSAMLILMGNDKVLDQMSDDDIADLVREQPKDWSDTLNAHTASYMPDPIWEKSYYYPLSN